MYRLLRTMGIWMMVMSAPLAWASQEYANNGDFSQGNTGFTSAYKDYYTNQASCYSYDARGPLMRESCYAITNDPYSVHVGGYHRLQLGSQGNVMVVNGAQAPVVIWMQPVQISAGHVYRWSAKAASNVTNAVNGTIGDPDPAELALQLAHSPGACTTDAAGFETIATIVTTSYGLNVVNNLFTAPNWVSAQGTTTRAQDGQYCLRIYDTNTALSGNDFLLDHLSFLDVTPTPVSSATPVAVPTLNATGLLALSSALGWLGLRRRRKLGSGVR